MQLGMIGLGRMGANMVRRLMKGGHECVVFDMSPQAVEAHHLRGAALAALGRDAEAQVAFSLALALDPDDPETLRAVADFYINGNGERGVT